MVATFAVRIHFQFILKHIMCSVQQVSRAFMQRSTKMARRNNTEHQVLYGSVCASPSNLLCCCFEYCSTTETRTHKNTTKCPQRAFTTIMLRTATLCVCMGVLGDADIQVLHRSVAAHHCVIEHHKNGKVYIEDLTNGQTTLNMYASSWCTWNSLISCLKSLSSTSCLF